MARKERFCAQCGTSIGEIEDRYHARGDTCGQQACERAARDEEREERDNAHADLDDRMGW